MRAFVAGTFLLLASAGGLAAQSTNDWNWRGVVTGEIQVRGVLGDIHLVRTAGNEVIARARKHGERSDESSVKIEVVKVPNGVRICAVYPTPEDSEHENSCDPKEHHGNNTRDNDVHVDFTIEVPDGLNVDARTVVGDVDAANIHGDVDAASVTGSVDVDATGIVSARSVSGDVHARLGQAKPDQDLEFQTVSGDITIEVPKSFAATVRLRSQFGEVESDFPVTLQKTRFGGAIRSAVNGGGAEVYASTVSGRIALKAQ